MKHVFLDTPQCPYCDSAQTGFYLKPSLTHPIPIEIELTCVQCKKNFLVYPEVTVNFSTVGDCALNKALPHHLSREHFGGDHAVYHCVKCFATVWAWALPDGKNPQYTPQEVLILEKPRKTVS